MVTKKYYDNIDFLRAFSAIGILCMHVLYNGGYKIGGTYLIQVIASMGTLVRLFFTISGFSICCGYYQKVKAGGLDFNSYYIKRYNRILPFFALLAFAYGAESIVTRSMKLPEIMSEVIADLSLLFGLFPGSTEMSIVGLGWTLGPIFAFYVLFPFFVFLCWTKRRSWLALIASVAISVVCAYHFTPTEGTIRSSIMVQAPYFIVGMVIYMYSEQIERFIDHDNWRPYLSTALGLGLLVLVPKRSMTSLNMVQSIVGCALALMGTVGSKNNVFSNRMVKRISGISMEIYLCHALLFGIINRLGFVRLSSNNWVNYIYSCVVTLLLAGSCAEIWKFTERRIVHRKT